MLHQNKQRFFLFGTIIAYCLIGVEIIIMISPFALYFYSVYGPILEFFSTNPYLSWTTEFFLPHMVFLDDPLIIGLAYLQVFFVIGLLLFFSPAIPLYYCRFAKKGDVQKGFYSKIRHPQYLFLAISGFGLLLYWPRFINIFNDIWLDQTQMARHRNLVFAYHLYFIHSSAGDQSLYGKTTANN